jgi:serine/threonine protein kinase
MPHYKFKTRDLPPPAAEDASGYQSGYESDGGTKYLPVKRLGKGKYAEARLFKDLSGKAVAVLNPVKKPADVEEARVKYRFFETIYPHMRPYLCILEEDYRLVVPYIDHIPYQKFRVSKDAPCLQKLVFKSASQAIKDCHDKGMIMIDLKGDNIYFDRKTGNSYLIDGGLSAPPGEKIDALAFQGSSDESLEECRINSYHIAPECWSLSPVSVVATFKMDLYSLGVLMKSVLQEPSSEIQLLLNRCLDKDPEKRPPVEELIADLEVVDNSYSDAPH